MLTITLLSLFIIVVVAKKVADDSAVDGIPCSGKEEQKLKFEIDNKHVKWESEDKGSTKWCSIGNSHFLIKKKKKKSSWQMQTKN